MYLHTWSLAVEEQFYLIYPMLLTIVYRYANLWLGRIILVSVAASFVVSLLFYFHASGLAFFLLPSRAWQLGLGAIVALQLLPAIRSGVIRKSVSLVGLAMILASLIFIDESWQIPAPWALPASLGTALLIAYGRKGPTATILSFAPFVWIGTISYSLYLWHWPIMVLHNVSSNHPTTEMQTAGIIMASVIMGAVSFYFVERPALQRCIALPAGSTVVAGGVAMASLALAAITVSKVPESVRRQII